MQIATERLGEHLQGLAQKSLKPCYTTHGDEALLAQEAQDAIRAAARAQGFSERKVFTVGPHFDWAEPAAAAGSMSLFADKQIIELRVPSGKPGKEGSAAIQALCESVAASDGATLLMVSLPRLDKATQSGAWFGALDAHGVTLKVDPIERRALPAWIAQRLQKQGQRVASGEAGQRALAFFADRVEGNLLAAHQEVQKLGLLYPPGELSEAQIADAVLDVARYDVFKLSEAVLAGQTARVMRIADGLAAAGTAAVLGHWALAEDARALLRVKAANASRPMAMVLRENRVWGLKEKLFERLLPRVSEGELDALVEAAAQCDGVVKGLRLPDWPNDAWDAVRELALRMSRTLHRQP
jgi:DNA polymerase III subunit delta